MSTLARSRLGGLDSYSCHLDPLIQGLKYVEREGPGKTQQALGSQGMGLFWLVEKLQFFIFFSIAFQVWGWSLGPLLLSHTPVQEMAFLRVGFVGSGPSLESWLPRLPPHRAHHS